jgi:hypothetical protein
MVAHPADDEAVDDQAGVDVVLPARVSERPLAGEALIIDPQLP